MEGKIKTVGVGVADEVADNNTAPTAEITALDSYEDSDSSDKEELKEENRPRKGPATILYGGDGTLAHVLASEEEAVLERAAATAEAAQKKKESDKVMPLTEVVKNCRHNECVPLSTRLANAKKHDDSLGPTNLKGGGEQAPLVDKRMWPTNPKEGGEQAAF